MIARRQWLALRRVLGRRRSPMGFALGRIAVSAQVITRRRCAQGGSPRKALIKSSISLAVNGVTISRRRRTPGGNGTSPAGDETICEGIMTDVSRPKD